LQVAIGRFLLADRKARGFGKAADGGDVLCPGALSALLSAAVHEGIDLNPAPDEKKPGALGAVDLVGRQTEHVASEGGHAQGNFPE
jgi:hypothetical protein